MNTDDDKFPILVRRDSYPGIVRIRSLAIPQKLTFDSTQLSASSAALDLAPLSQTPSHAQRNFGPGGRAAASEWPQFQGARAGDSADSPSTTSVAPSGTPSSLERHRSVTHDTSLPAGGQGERSSPRPARTGAGQLPPPRSSLPGVGGSPSGRSSPVVEKKLGGLDGGMSKVNGYGGIDTITDQFSNVSVSSLKGKRWT
jgi:hypothetical protein